MGRMPHDIRIWGRIVGVRSTKQFVKHLLIPTSILSSRSNRNQKKFTFFWHICPFHDTIGRKYVTLHDAEEEERLKVEKRIIQVDEKVPAKLLIPLSIQHMFAMFGASVLVPFMFGLNPAIVLFMNGVGTFLFILITKGKAPAYLGSSFAFLAPAGAVIAKYGFEYAQGGFVVVGICGCLLALIIYKFGTKWIDIVLPPAAMGPVVALIGLELAGSAASTAGLINVETVDSRNVIVFLVTLGVAVFGQVLFRGFLSVIPILIAIIAGYIAELSAVFWILPK